MMEAAVMTSTSRRETKAARWSLSTMSAIGSAKATATRATSPVIARTSRRVTSSRHPRRRHPRGDTPPLGLFPPAQGC